MSTSSIQSWANVVEHDDESFSNDANSTFAWNGSEATWDEYFARVCTALLSSSTKIRTSVLRHLIVLVKETDLSPPQATSVVTLLAMTYTRYVDAASRDASEALGSALIRRDHLHSPEDQIGITDQIISWLHGESIRICEKVDPGSIAASVHFALLHWACGIHTTCLQLEPSFTKAASWPKLVHSIAYLIDSLLLTDKAKPGLLKSAVDRTRRALRNFPDSISPVLATLLHDDSVPSIRKTALLGVGIDVVLRLKQYRGPNILETHIPNIESFYLKQILASRTPVPRHRVSAFSDFISSAVRQEDLKKTYLPAFEKALLRSPEVSLSVCSAFCTSYTRSHELSDDELQRILSPALNNAKSSNANTRRDAIALFESIMKPSTSEKSKLYAVQELVALPRASKTASLEHRVSLYEMLGAVSPGPDGTVAREALRNIAPLLSKESNDIALRTLCNAAEPHLLLLVSGRVNESVPEEAMNLILQGIASSKPILRKYLCILVGNVLWTIGKNGIYKEDQCDSESRRVIASMLQALANNLKNVETISPSTTSGILEGYISVSVLLGPLAEFGDIPGRVINDHPSLIGFVGQGQKSKAPTSFLLWDKIYQKLELVDEEVWFLRSLEALASHPSVSSAPVPLEEDVYKPLGLAFVHLAVTSKHVQTRRNALSVLSDLTMRSPKIANGIIVTGLESYVSLTSSTVDETKTHRLAQVLSACASYSQSATSQIKNAMLCRTLLLGHHPYVGEQGKQGWIELVQKAGVDPAVFVAQHVKPLLSLVSSPDSREGRAENLLLRTARFRAIATLIFVNSDALMPQLMERTQYYLDTSRWSWITQQDIEIWKTLDGTLYVDVLVSNKGIAPSKGKEQEIQKWEAEIRKDLASKRGGKNPVPHSKEDEKKVQLQLQSEKATRVKVEGIKQSILEGLDIIRSIVSSRSASIRQDISRLAKLLLACSTSPVSQLVGSAVIDTYLDIGLLCQDSFSSVSQWVGIATLRARAAVGIPTNMQLEPLEGLVLRVLYRCTTLAEQVPFDAPTFCYIAPVITTVIQSGGLSPSSDDSAQEQLILALNLIKLHTARLRDTTYPRADMMANVIHILSRHFQLAKEGASALIDMGEAMQMNSSREEIDFLLQSTLVEEPHARNAILQALQPCDLTDFDWSPALWIACHDRDEQNARLAGHIWEDNGLDVIEDYTNSLLELLGHGSSSVRWNVCRSLPQSVTSWPDSLGKLLASLKSMYFAKIPNLEPQYDNFGIIISNGDGPEDQWQVRKSVGNALEVLAQFLTDTETGPFLDFLINQNALGDQNAEVRGAMLQAGIAAIDSVGSSQVDILMQRFEEHLIMSDASTAASDYIQESVIVLFGRLAGHLEPGDHRRPNVVERLVQALNIPSETVQVAVASCLSPLVATIPHPELLVDRLMHSLTDSPRYAERRGAAYGLAGAVHGLGISSLKTFGILRYLKSALDNKKQFEYRQGAVFAFETLSSTLGRLFEPYITEIVPLLLGTFGDSIPDVREATTDASKTIMATVSAYGVKLILPELLEALEEKQWRTKKGAIELMGSMAFCSPKQLSISLPAIIPRLTGVLTDSHAQVRTAANKSLKQFGEVINNPEIQAMVPVLLKALVDPDKIAAGLASLLGASFMHYIDSPSLALVIPILERGLKQRGEPKRKACQIVGNLSSLTDPNDFVSYLPRLMPLVLIVLVDPVPEARATAAKTLGTLVERMGEVHFTDLVPRLLSTLKSETSAIDRQGAAQGLSEVLSGLGMERLEGLLPDIIGNCSSPRPYVREGFMSLLVYLPATFGTRFQPHLPKTVSPILNGLADDEQTVQDAAMRAGRMIISNYSRRAVDLLLPELESSMFSDGWKIRQSSITLVGELLFKISGISGKTEVEDEETEIETAALEISKKMLTDILGKERRDRLLSAFYILRQDTVSVVRLSAIHIWKALVHNTPRTVRDILSSLVEKVIDLLPNVDGDQQDTAARTMGELCRKFGERIVAEIVPLLRKSAQSHHPRTREGVCLALSDIMENTTDAQREGHEDEIISIVRTSLVDSEPNVRAAAAKAFDMLQRFIGVRAIDRTIPTLLEALRHPGESSGTALQALQEVMNVRAATVFPALLPTLLANPITSFNLQALTSLVTVAGQALSKRITAILGTLVKVLETVSELVKDAEECIRAIVRTVEDAEGLNTLMLLLLEWAKHEHAARRVNAARIFSFFCQESQTDASFYHVDWVRQLIGMFDDRDSTVVASASDAFNAFCKSVPKEEYESLVVPLRRSIESTGAPGRSVAGFSMPNALPPIVPILIAGLTGGNSEQREQSAYAIADLVARTEQSSFKPFVIPFTGALIRLATQAAMYPPGVKIAIMSALETELGLIPVHVKPFFPQLQRTFAKFVGDPASVTVRSKAGDCLGVLMQHQPRADQICTELLTGCRSNEDVAIQASYIFALAKVVQAAHASISDNIKNSVMELLEDTWGDHPDAYTEASALLFASMAHFPELVSPLVNSHLTAISAPSQASSIVILTVLQSPDPGPELFSKLQVAVDVARQVASSAASDKGSIARNAKEAREIMRSHPLYAEDRSVQAEL